MRQADIILCPCQSNYMLMRLNSISHTTMNAAPLEQEDYKKLRKGFYDILKSSINNYTTLWWPISYITCVYLCWPNSISKQLWAERQCHDQRLLKTNKSKLKQEMLGVNRLQPASTGFNSRDPETPSSFYCLKGALSPKQLPLWRGQDLLILQHMAFKCTCADCYKDNSKEESSVKRAVIVSGLSRSSGWELDDESRRFGEDNGKTWVQCFSFPSGYQHTGQVLFA